MAGGKEEETGAGGYVDPLYLSSADGPQMQLSTMLFDGGNFLNWSRNIKMALGSKNKLGFIDGSCPKPEDTSKDFNKWVRNDYMIRCWIFKSMTVGMAQSLMLMESSKQLWDELMERYGESNAPQLYQLKREVAKLEQDKLSISEYYCQLRKCWDEIQSLEAIPSCDCGAMSKCTCNLYKKMLEMGERNKLIDFLMGLNDKYENVRGNIMGMDPLPTVNKAFHLVQQVEKQKEVTSGGGKGGMDGSDISAFQARRYEQKEFQKRDYKKEKMSKKCEHCGFRGHLKAECFKLNGTPQWFKDLHKGKGGGKFAGNVGRQGSDGGNDTPLDDELYDFEGKGSTSGSKPDADMISAVVKEVMKAFSSGGGASNNRDTARTSNFAGKIHASNVANYNETYDCESWIVDTGASDHMGGNIKLFSDLKKLEKHVNVGLPDGSITRVSQAGTVKLSPNITLRDVLYIPDFKNNLLSVSKVVEGSKIEVVFDDNGCVFQDLYSKEEIGYGKEEYGLYKFQKKKRKKNEEEMKKEDDNVFVGNVKSSLKKVKLNVMHARLGHSSLSKMEHLDFCDCRGIKEFFCDTCHLAKHHKLPFYPSKNNASLPFDLIHVDLWGPYRVKNITGASYFLTILDDYSR